MSNRNDDLKRLRAEVRKRRSQVTAKENRIKRRTGVDIRDTSEDPRRPVNVVERYNRPQLIAYYRELDAFMSRSVGYVAGANNTPIPKLDWLQYKRLEKKYNDVGNAHFDKVADIFIPQAGMTIAQRDATMRPDSISAQGDIVNRPYSPLDRRANNIASKEALDKLVKDINRKLNRGYLPGALKEARTQLSSMLTAIGNPDLINKAENLTDTQLDILWNYTNFASNISGIYFLMTKNAADTGSNDSWRSSVVEDFSNDIRELFDWAGGQAKTGKPTRRSSARRGSGKKGR